MKTDFAKLISFTTLTKELFNLNIRLRQFWVWMFDGLGLLVPSRWRAIGWKLYRGEINSQTRDITMIERSFLGSERPALKDVTEKHAVINRTVLADDQIFISQITLPRTAKSSIERTLRLRLDEFSPLPFEKTMLAWQIEDQNTDNRLTVNVAIARKPALTSDSDILSDANIIEVTSTSSIGNLPKFVFERRINSDRKISQGMIRTPLAIVLSGLLLVFGANQYVNQLENRTTDRERQLITMIKAEKKLQTKITAIANDATTQPKPVTASHLVRELNHLHEQFPDKAVLLTLDFSNATATGTGFIPFEQVGTYGPFLKIDTKPSDRPGFAEANFSYSMEPGE